MSEHGVSEHGVSEHGVSERAPEFCTSSEAYLDKGRRLLQTVGPPVAPGFDEAPHKVGTVKHA
jgi:hypothetical protein